MATTLPDHELQLSEAEQRELWKEWEERGPQGPIEDDCGTVSEAPNSGTESAQD